MAIFKNSLFCKSKQIDNGPHGLAVLENPYRPRPRPSIWSLYRPVDITLYDLMYEDDWRKWESWHRGQHSFLCPVLLLVMFLYMQRARALMYFIGACDRSAYKNNYYFFSLKPYIEVFMSDNLLHRSCIFLATSDFF